MVLTLCSYHHLGFFILGRMSLGSHSNMFSGISSSCNKKDKAYGIDHLLMRISSTRDTRDQKQQHKGMLMLTRYL